MPKWQVMKTHQWIGGKKKSQTRRIQNVRCFSCSRAHACLHAVVSNSTASSVWCNSKLLVSGQMSQHARSCRQPLKNPTLQIWLPTKGHFESIDHRRSCILLPFPVLLFTQFFQLHYLHQEGCRESQWTKSPAGDNLLFCVSGGLGQISSDLHFIWCVHAHFYSNG